MDPIEPGPVAKSPPVPRKRPLFFYVMILASMSLVLGTVLLSNDMRHLRHLLKATNQEWLIAGIPPAGSTAQKPLPQKPASHPAEPLKTIKIDKPRLFSLPEDKIATALRRTWQMTGPDMCRKLRQAGTEMSPWQASVIGGEVYECSYEKIYASEKSLPASSLFVIVRGDASGRISNIRAKLVAPPRDSEGRLDPALVSIFEAMLTQSRWGDFDAELEAIRSLRDIKKDGFGASLSFIREVTDARNFNFLLSLKATTPEQRRLNDLFRAENGFDVPGELAGSPSSADILGGEAAMGMGGRVFPSPNSVPAARRKSLPVPSDDPDAVPRAEPEPASATAPLPAPKRKPEERKPRLQLPHGPADR